MRTRKAAVSFIALALILIPHAPAYGEDCAAGVDCEKHLTMRSEEEINNNRVAIDGWVEETVPGTPPADDSPAPGPADIAEAPPVAEQAPVPEAAPAPEVLQSPSNGPGPTALAPTGRYDLECEAREGFSFNTGLCMRDRPLKPDTSSPLLYSGGRTTQEPVPYDYEKYGVDTRTIIRRASRTLSVPGAGLTLNPRTKGWTSIPILLRARTPSHTINATMFGKTIPVTFKARRFSYEFHDGSDPLVTDNPGKPYPYMGLQHIFHKGNPAQTITLTTTWDATCTNPWTGETLTLSRALVTVETSDPFPVIEIHTHLTDTAEEEAGH